MHVSACLAGSINLAVHMRMCIALALAQLQVRTVAASHLCFAALGVQPVSCRPPCLLTACFFRVHLQTPSDAHRAAPYNPKAALLYTGNDAAAARTLSEGMLSSPSLTPSVLLDAQTYLSSLSGDLAQLEQQQGVGSVVLGELLSLMGLRRLGTSSRVKGGLYLETALMGVRAGCNEGAREWHS
jgi:hypothetical protein